MNSKFMKFIAAIALPTLISLSSSMAYSAEGDRYFGIQFSNITFENPGGLEWEPSAIVGKYGSFLSDNFAIEGRFGIGTGSDTQTGFVPGFGIVDIEIEVDTLIGIYGVGHHNVSNNTSVYALLGFTQGDATFNVSGAINGSASEDDTDMSYGVGANIGIGESAGINLEYVSYISKSDFDISALNVGFVAKF